MPAAGERRICGHRHYEGRRRAGSHIENPCRQLNRFGSVLSCASSISCCILRDMSNVVALGRENDRRALRADAPPPMVTANRSRRPRKPGPASPPVTKNDDAPGTVSEVCLAWSHGLAYTVHRTTLSRGLPARAGRLVATAGFSPGDRSWPRHPRLDATPRFPMSR
jgi:hypothetical protein